MITPATWAIVPVKRFTRAKLRLSSILTVARRAALTRAVFEDLLDSLRGAQEIDALCVISDEPSLEESNPAYHLLRDPLHGDLNDVVGKATVFAMRHGATTSCIVHADLPLASSRSVSRLLQGHRARNPNGVTLIPDRKRLGTNVMIRTPADAIRCRYGERSLDAHRAEAGGCRIPVKVETDDTLSLDIDDERDLQMLLCAYRLEPAATGSRTGSFLAGLGNETRPRTASTRGADASGRHGNPTRQP